MEKLWSHLRKMTCFRCAPLTWTQFLNSTRILFIVAASVSLLISLIKCRILSFSSSGLFGLPLYTWALQYNSKLWWKTNFKEWSNPFPSRSPGLTAPDIFLWGYCKAHVYKSKPNNPAELKERIRHLISEISRDTLAATMNNALVRTVLRLMVHIWSRSFSINEFTVSPKQMTLNKSPKCILLLCTIWILQLQYV